MLRTMWTQLRRDEDGMSVLELVLAAFILFFVFTAMLGLIGTTTKMGQNAKARVAMTNAVSSHMEWVRSLEFDEVDLVGTTADGVVEPTYTYTVDGYTVTISNQISVGQDGTKELEIAATANSPNFSGISMTTFAAIRDDSGLSLYTLEEESVDAPIVEFTSMTPVADTTVYGSHAQGEQALYIEADAEAQVDGAIIAEMRYYCQGELLRNGSTIFAPIAEWTPGVSPARELFRWDSTQVDENGDPVIDDGWRLVYVIVTDDEGNEGRAERRFYVDNYDPQAPGEMKSEVQDDTETRLSWGVAMDGTDPTFGYKVQVYSYDTLGDLYGYPEAPTEDPAYIHQGSSFSRYTARVKAVSPRNNESDWTNLAEPYTTRPHAWGESTTRYVPKNRSFDYAFTDVEVFVDMPNFGTTGDVTYDVYRSSNPEDMGARAYESDIGGPYFAEEVQETVNRGQGLSASQLFYYQFRVTYVATGPGGGQEEEIWSDVIGPTTANAATEQMVHATW